MATINGSTSNSDILTKIVWSYTQSVSGNYSDVTATLYYKRDDSYTTYGTWSGKIYINGSATSGSKSLSIGTSWVKALAATQRVYHNTDGTKSIKIQATGGISGTTLSSTTYSTTAYTLTAIPRASSISVGTITLGSAKSITITRASSSFTHTITYKWYNLSGTIVTKTSNTSVSWTPTLSTFAAQIPNNTSGTGALICTTYSGTTKIGSKSISFTANIPSSVVPTISNFTATRVDNTVPSTWGIYVKSKSQCTLTTTAAGKYGSSIKSYTVKQGSTTIGTSSSGTTSSITTPVINTSGTITYTVTIKDSRGRTASDTVSISVVDYSEPTISSLLSQRCLSNGTINDDGTYISAKCTYSYSNCSSKNTLTRTVYYRKSGTSTWTTGTSFSSGTAVVIGGGNIGLDYSYEVKYELKDQFNTIYQIDEVSTSFSIVDFKSGGKGIALGKAAETDYECEVALKLNPSGGFKFPLLSSGDFNNLTDFNIYGISNFANFSNAPPTISGTAGFLEVFPSSAAGAIVQRFTEAHKVTPSTFLRFYYSSAWGDWIRQPLPQKVFATGLEWSSGTRTLTGISDYKVIMFRLKGEGTRVIAINELGVVRGGNVWVNGSNHIITFSVSCTISGDVLTYVNSGYMMHTASGSHGAWQQKAIQEIVGIA